MELAHRWQDRNLTRLELVFTVIILAILIGVFFRHALLIFSKVERSMVEKSIININSALNLRVSMLVASGKGIDPEIVLKKNPIEFTSSRSRDSVLNEDKINIMEMMTETSVIPLTRYGGNILSDKIGSVEKGFWYYQLNDSLLVYVIRNDEYFSNTISGPKRMRFETVIEYKDINQNGRFDNQIDAFNSVKLKALNEFTWDL